MPKDHSTRIKERAARLEPLADLLPLILLAVLLPSCGSFVASVIASVFFVAVALIYGVMKIRCRRTLFRWATILFILLTASISLLPTDINRLSVWVVSGGMWLLLIGEIVRIVWVYRRLRDESWLPLVASDGRCIGRIARSVADSAEALPADSLLPVVRVLALCGDMVYLQRHILTADGACQSGHTLHCDCISDQNKDLPTHCTGAGYDTPFSDYIGRFESAEDAARRLVYSRFCGIVRPEVRFLVRYTPQQSDRLVLLFLLQVAEPDLLLHHQCPMEGKWWPIAQMREADRCDFCGYIREEIPFINQTVRLADSLRRIND